MWLVTSNQSTLFQHSMCTMVKICLWHPLQVINNRCWAYVSAQKTVGLHQLQLYQKISRLEPFWLLSQGVCNLQRHLYSKIVNHWMRKLWIFPLGLASPTVLGRFTYGYEILIYFVRGSITERLTICLTALDSTKHVISFDSR